MENRFGMDLARQYSQAEYKEALLNARVGLDIFGFGYDTVRYWEVPAHGAMLLAERKPTRIPNNFEDGESAVYFDSLKDLEEKVAHYLAHPDEAAVIAAAGREHFLTHHTSSARARDFLGRLETLLAVNSRRESLRR